MNSTINEMSKMNNCNEKVVIKNYEKEFASDFINLASKYDGVENYIQKMAESKVRSLIVNGPSGLGKTYSVNSYLEKYAKGNFKIISGHMTFLSLYVALYAHRESGKILVLDDVDSVFSKLEGLNILKAVMDTTEHRTVHWASSSHILSNLGIPQSFNYCGGVVLISNIGFGGEKSKVLAHLNALKDRSYCIPIADGSEESLFKQVCFMVLKRGLLTKMGVEEGAQLRLLNYIELNKKKLTTISLRTLYKLAEIYKMDSDNWEDMANQGLLKGV